MVRISLAPSNFAFFCSFSMRRWLSPSASSFMLSSGVEIESGSDSSIFVGSFVRESSSSMRAPA